MSEPATSFRERIKPPYRVEATESGFRVVSADGIALCYVYTFETRMVAGHGEPKLTHAEGRALAGVIAALGDAPAAADACRLLE